MISMAHDDGPKRDHDQVQVDTTAVLKHYNKCALKVVSAFANFMPVELQ
jgi:hypothetical protein